MKSSEKYYELAGKALEKASFFEIHGNDCTRIAEELLDERIQAISTFGGLHAKYDSFKKLAREQRKSARYFYRRRDHYLDKHERIMARYHKAKKKEKVDDRARAHQS